jgi:hypothetical protein
MKNQIHHRLCAPLIHDVLERFCNNTITRQQAVETLGISKSQLYRLRTQYIHAKTKESLINWMPGHSGGDRATDLPPRAQNFLQRALAEGYNHAFAASELLRLHNIECSRWSARRFAIANGLAQTEAPIRLPAHTRRWQRQNIGELWQLDATPHRWFGPDEPLYPLLDMIDDASRLQVGIRLCRHEGTTEYVFFFEKTFRTYGLPLCVYVDYASFFYSPKDGRLTPLGWRLAFYGVSLRYANTPQGKGKIERIHQVWQDRLPPFLRLNGFTAESAMRDINPHLEALASHRNRHETHREIGMAPQTAWDEALARGHTKLRPVPRDAWWPYIWSVWRACRVGKQGRVSHQDLFFPTQLAEGEKVILCEHGDGCYSVIKELPKTHEILPVVLFTNRPKEEG